jgi:tetratricopeptide (TPR) repeat protein
VAAARRDRQDEITVYRQMLRADGNNHQVEERLLYALRFLAELHLAGGDIVAANRDLDEAARLSARLLALEPDNTGWIKAGAHIALDRADILLALHDPAAAKQLAQARMQIAALLARDPTNFLWHRDLQAPALLLQAKLPGDASLQARSLAQALRELDALHERTPHDRRVRSLLAQALMLQGDGDEHVGDHAAALHAWQRGLALLPAAPALLEPDSRCIRAGLLARTGSTTAAARDFADLQRIGYRHPGYVTTAGDVSRSAPVADQPPTARRSQ